jgi:3-isopropylmalate dehydrogenase
VGHRIGIIGGDGIGPEVVAEALKVVAATGVAFDTVDYDLGGRRYLDSGEVLPDSVLDEIRGLDGVLLGAVGTPEVPPGVLERGLLLRLRFELDLYVNLRPVKLLPGAPTPLAGKGPADIDMVVVRENTEGAYVGEGGLLRAGTPHEVATQGSVSTRLGVERCVRYAFELARTRERKHLTLLHKTNVLTYSGDLWYRTFQEVATEFPDVGTQYHHIDAACLYFCETPDRYDVIVTDNLFGDIITDLGAAIAGGLGLAASGNLNPPRTAPSIFEPVHGSAPDIAGRGIANPLAMILSAALMLRHGFSLEDEAAALESAVDRALAAGLRTGDLGGSATTAEATEAVLKEL